MKIVLVGAGSAQFGYGTLGDIFCSKVLKGTEVVLHDINAHTLKTEFRLKSCPKVMRHCSETTAACTI